MTSHRDIIQAAGGYGAFAEKIGHKPERVRFWVMRDSIPPEVWPRIVRADLATLEQLDAAREARFSQAG